MNLFELFVKIGADTSQAEKGMKNTQKNSETLANKIKVMSVQFDAAQKNVYKLTQEFNESVKKTGAASKETQELAKRLDDAEKEAEQAKKALDSYNSEVEETEEKTEKASGGLSNFASKLGKGLATAAQIGAAAVGVAAAGIAALTTAAINNFAEYEQLAGGAQKIFDQMDYSQIAADANNAYKELGMSANEYLAVINDVGASFSATMGDKKGYEAAKTGLKAISDYASGTGKNLNELSQKFTLITRSTSSYQSIADQFSGILPATSAGFLEQAQAAGLLSEKYEQLTEVPIEEYQEAVSKMLEQGVADLGLANNTMNEAFSTLSGSLSMAKGAWSNLVTGIANDSADLDALIGNFVESVGAVADQLIPKISTALIGASTLVSELIPAFVEEIPAIIEENLPALASAAVSIIQSIVTGISENKDLLINTILSVVGIIIDQFPAIANGILSALPGLVSSILGALPGLIRQIVSALTDGGVIKSLTEAVVGIVQAIADNLPEIIQAILDAIPMITESVNEAILENFPALLAAIIQIVLTIVQNLPSIIQTLVDQIGPIVSTIVQVIVENAPAFIAGIAQIIFELVKALPELLVSLGDSIFSIFEGIGTGLSEAWPKFKEGIAQVWDNLVAWFDGLWEKTKEIGGNIIDGIKTGISDAWNNLVEWFSGLFDDLIGIAKKILGIASPSKVFKKIGLQTAEGYEIGFNDEFANVKKDMEDAMTFDDMAVNIGASVRRVGNFAGASQSAGYGGVQDVNVTITIDENVDAMGLARELLPFLKIAEREAYA